MQSLAVGHVSTASYGKPRITNQVKPVPLSLHLTIQLIACPLTCVSMHVMHTPPQGQKPCLQNRVLADPPIASMPIVPLPVAGVPLVSMPLVSMPVVSMSVISLPIASMTIVSWAYCLFYLFINNNGVLVACMQLQLISLGVLWGDYPSLIICRLRASSSGIC